jgi:hypothetical protein
VIHRFRIIEAKEGSSEKKESTMPKIPENRIKTIPQPKAAFRLPKGAFFNAFLSKSKRIFDDFLLEAKERKHQ